MKDTEILFPEDDYYEFKSGRTEKSPVYLLAVAFFFVLIYRLMTKL